MERTLLDELDKNKQKPITKKAKEIKAMSKKLQEDPNHVAIPTDKTNSFKVVTLKRYKEWVQAELGKNAQVIDHKRLEEIYEKAMLLLTSLEGTISEKEYNYVKYTLRSKSIPTPKNLIKDHKMN